MTNDEIKQMIAAGIHGAEIYVEVDDGVHFQATIISSSFEGLSRVKQHQTVYQSLGNSMESAIHALSLQTYTPDQWQQKMGSQVL